MTLVSSTLFWVFTIVLGFVNPLISFGLIILYYLPGIIQNICHSDTEHTENEMKSFSEDVLEDMK